MKALFLNTNFTCDLACRYCFYEQGHENRLPLHLDVERIPELATKIRRLGFQTVILTGGDPLSTAYREETFVLIEALKSENLRVILNTSGVRLAEYELDRLIALGVDRIDLSINSYDCKVHNRERGGFDGVVKTMRYLLSKGYRNISTTTVITPSNAETAPATIKWLMANGIEDARFQPVYLQSEFDYSLIEPAMIACKNQLRRAHLTDYLALCRAVYNQEPIQSQPLCQMAKSYLVCHPDGSLYPCFHREDFLIGNIFDTTEEKLRARIQASEFSTRCPGCLGRYCVSLFDNPDCYERR